MKGDADEEISFVDVLLLVAENWILLLILPVVLGALAFVVLTNQPRVFVSDVILDIPASEILDTVEIGLADGTVDPALAPAKSGSVGLEVVENEESRSSQITLTYTDPVAFTAFGRLIADLTNGPLAYSREYAAARSREYAAAGVERLEHTLSIRNAVIMRLETALTDLSAEDSFNAEAYAGSALALDQMIASRTSEEIALERLRTELAAATISVQTAHPSDPRLAGRSPIALAGMVSLGAGLVLLALVFARTGLKAAATKPQNRAKFLRIKNAFLLRKTQLDN